MRREKQSIRIGCVEGVGRGAGEEKDVEVKVRVLPLSVSG